MMRNEPFEFEGEKEVCFVGKLDLPDGPWHSFVLFARR
jgi:hypothetical protein